MYGAWLVNTTKVVDDGVPLETTLRVYWKNKIRFQKMNFSILYFSKKINKNDLKWLRNTKRL